MNDKETKSAFDLLPNVILDLIFSRLLIEDVVSMMKTCKKLNNFGKKDSYWKKHFERQEVKEWLIEEKKEGRNLYSQIAELIKKYPHLAVYFTERIGNCIQFETLFGELFEIENTIKNNFQKKLPNNTNKHFKMVVLGGGIGCFKTSDPVKEKIPFFIFFIFFDFFFYLLIIKKGVFTLCFFTNAYYDSVEYISYDNYYIRSKIDEDLINVATWSSCKFN